MRRLAAVLVAAVLSTQAQASNLTAEQKTMLEAVIIAGLAIEACGYGGQDRIDGVAEAYGVSKDKLEPVDYSAILSRLEFAALDKQHFCADAWSRFGENGTVMAGMLTRSAEMGSAVGDWEFEQVTGEDGGFSHCNALRGVADGSDQMTLENGKLDFTVQRDGMEFDPYETYTMIVEVGDRVFKFETEDSLGMVFDFPIDDDMADLLRQAQGFRLRVEDRSVNVSVPEFDRIVGILGACERDGKKG